MFAHSTLTDRYARPASLPAFANRWIDRGAWHFDEMVDQGFPRSDDARDLMLHCWATMDACVVGALQAADFAAGRRNVELRLLSEPTAANA
jgi:hypothetical protein